MRVYLHYKTPAVPYDENDPCCDQDGGMLKDYKVVTGDAPISIANVSSESFSVYPNPTEGTLYVMQKKQVNICFTALMEKWFKKVW